MVSHKTTHLPHSQWTAVQFSNPCVITMNCLCLQSNTNLINFNIDTRNLTRKIFPFDFKFVFVVLIIIKADLKQTSNIQKMPNSLDHWRFSLSANSNSTTNKITYDYRTFIHFSTYENCFFSGCLTDLNYTTNGDAHNDSNTRWKIQQTSWAASAAVPFTCLADTHFSSIERGLSQ